MKKVIIEFVVASFVVLLLHIPLHYFSGVDLDYRFTFMSVIAFRILYYQICIEEQLRKKKNNKKNV